jgi:hypothetical protein
MVLGTGKALDDAVFDVAIDDGPVMGSPEA